MQLHESIGVIKGIGEKTEKLFAKMDVFTVEDLLEHYPRGYDAFEVLKSLQAAAEIINALTSAHPSVFCLLTR